MISRLNNNNRKYGGYEQWAGYLDEVLALQGHEFLNKRPYLTKSEVVKTALSVYFALEARFGLDQHTLHPNLPDTVWKGKADDEDAAAHTERSHLE